MMWWWYGAASHVEMLKAAWSLLTSIWAYNGCPVEGTNRLYDSSTPKLSCRRPIFRIKTHSTKLTGVLVPIRSSTASTSSSREPTTTFMPTSTGHEHHEHQQQPQSWLHLCNLAKWGVPSLQNWLCKLVLLICFSNHVGGKAAFCTVLVEEGRINNAPGNEVREKSPLYCRLLLMIFPKKNKGKMINPVPTFMDSGK